MVIISNRHAVSNLWQRRLHVYGVSNWPVEDVRVEDCDFDGQILAGYLSYWPMHLQTFTYTSSEP